MTNKAPFSLPLSPRPFSSASPSSAQRRDTLLAAAPPDGEACARPARTPHSARFAAHFVRGIPTRSLRAPHQHDFDARAFTRALCAGSQNHAGPATCSRAPVGSPASTLRSDHRLALAFASGWLVHRTSHRQAYPPAEGCPLSGCSGRGAATGAALSPLVRFPLVRFPTTIN